MVPDIGHLKEVFVQTGIDQGFLEKLLMGPGRAGGHDNTVQVLLLDDLRHLILGILGACKQVFLNIDHIRQGPGVLRHLRDPYHAPDVDAAIAHENPYPRRFPGYILFRRYLHFLSLGVTRGSQVLSCSTGGCAGFHDREGDILRPGKRSTGIDPRNRGGHRMETVRLGEMITVQLNAKAI